MIIRLQAAQIPQYWEVIKYVTTTVDEVDEKDLQLYLVELLHALLSDKAQCFVTLNEDRLIVTVGITRIRANKVTGEKYLFIQNIYSFQMASIQERSAEMTFVKEFARNAQCKYASFKSRNKRVWQIGEANGFEEKCRVFECRLGD